MYETLVTGTRFTHTSATRTDSFYGESSADGLSIIERIETVNGKVIYSRQTGTTKIIDSFTSASVVDILYNTVKHGTGRYAGNFVRLQSNDPERQQLLDRLNLPIPLLGKTGTANDFRNAAFVGYVPVQASGESFMQLPGGYSVGVYVGFDDNRSMKKGTTHITGAGGTLPTWSDIAMSLINDDNAADKFDLADLSFNNLPLRYDDTGQVFVPVDIGSGGSVIPGRGALRASVSPSTSSILSYGRVGSSGNFEPERLFRPFWKNQ